MKLMTAAIKKRVPPINSTGKTAIVSTIIAIGIYATQGKEKAK